MNGKENMRKGILGTAMLSLIIIGAVCAMMLIATTDIEQIVTSEGKRGWFTIASAEEGGGLVTGDDPGVLQVYIWQHNATPAVDYAINLSNASAYCYAWANSLNEAMTGIVPYDTPFDVMYKIRVNDTTCYNTTGSCWMADWVRMNHTCAALGIGADTAMIGVEIANNTDFMWMNFYLNNSGTGYTITHGQNVNMTVKLQAYF